MTIDRPLTPTSGLIADNVVGFARALRAAGIPVGPGAVIDALNALQVIEIGNRADVFTTLEAIFVKRHEHALIFAQAFDLFFRAAEDWKHMLDSVPLPDHARKKPPPASRRVQEALSQPQMSETPQAQEQELRLSVSDKEVLQKKDFAQMSAAEIAAVTRAIARDEIAAGRTAHPPLSAGQAGPAAGPAPHAARQPAHRRRYHRYPSPRADRQAGANRGAARYIRLDERIYQTVPAFPACHHRCPQARFGVSVRHQADQCDACAAGAGSRRSAGELFAERGGLGRRYPDRHLAAYASTSSGAGACSGRAPSCC